MSAPQLKWTRDPLRRERYIGSFVRSIISDYAAARKSISDCDAVSIGRRIISAVEDFDAQLAARMMIVTMEDGSQELRFVETIELAEEDDCGGRFKPRALYPELKDGEIMIMDITGRPFIHKEPG